MPYRSIPGRRVRGLPSTSAYAGDHKRAVRPCDRCGRDRFVTTRGDPTGLCFDCYSVDPMVWTRQR
ncbi:hypothetical protein GCM10027053_51500 [Intrasporangium mesophilum]